MRCEPVQCPGFWPRRSRHFRTLNPDQRAGTSRAWHMAMLHASVERSIAHFGDPGRTLKPTRDGRLGNLKPEFQQFAVDTRCPPSWVFSRHAKDHHPDLFVDRWTTSTSLSSGQPLPVEPKASAMPLNDSP